MKRRNVIPANFEAEETVIGSLLIDPGAVPLVRGMLEPRHFYREDYRAAYSAILQLSDAGLPIDVPSVVRELEKRGKPGQEADLTYLLNAVPSVMYIKEYASIVAHLAKLRGIIAFAGELAGMAYEEPKDLEGIRSLILDKGLALTGGRGNGFRPISESVKAVAPKIIDGMEKQRELVGLDTGLVALNRALGGLEPTDLVIIGGRPSMGKTALALTIALNVARCGIPVAFVSLEQSGERLVRRAVSMVSRVNSFDVRRGSVTEAEKALVKNSLESIESLPIFWNCQSGVTSAQVMAELVELAVTEDIQLVVLDYLGLLSDRDDSEVRRIGRITRNLKALAMRLEVPVIALHQLSRRTEHRANKLPGLADLRDSGHVEQDADVVLLLYREGYYDEDSGQATNQSGPCIVNIAKHRDGPTGKVQLWFDASLALFTDIEKKREEE